MTSFSSIPDEIVHHIISFLSPEDCLLSIQLLSRRYHRIACEGLLWREYCQSSFKFWNPEHSFQEKLNGRAKDVDWRALWFKRKRSNTHALKLLNGILESKVSRIARFEDMCLLGYDVKDFLLEQCHADESFDDVLARR
jgi:F-box protein 21